MRRLYLLLALWPALLQAAPETLRVAVASNFQPTLELIVEQFEQQHPGYQVDISGAASGILYNQIRHGAPFDLFLSADIEKIQRLEQENQLLASADYAKGKLVFWVPQAEQQVEASHWEQWDGRYAMANPTLAPYGRAASEVIQAIPPSRNSPVTAQNIAQSYQYVATGAVAGGFIAMSQAYQLPSAQYWEVDTRYYQPIVQRMGLLRDSPASRSLWQFLQSNTVKALIAEHGYLDESEYD